MAKYKTCIICGEYIEGTDIPSMIPYKNRYAHKRCFEKTMKSLKAEKDSLLKDKEKEKRGRKPKPKAELKDGLSEEEYQEKKAYYDYLRGIVEEDFNSKLYAITEMYIRKYGYTYTGMRDTQVYLNEIVQKDLTDSVLGLIPYYYDACAEYQAQLAHVETINKDINVQDMYSHKTVFVKPRVDVPKQIDITEIK